MRTAMLRSLLGVLFSLGLAATAAADDLHVFAAASLKPALDEILASSEGKALGAVAPSYAASSALARQIEAGAPADVFISADEEWMDYLAHEDLIVQDTRRDLLGNALVLVAPKDSRATLKIAPKFDLAGALGEGKLAVAEPNSVPAGKYARAALTQLGVWDAVQPKVVSTENVRAALALAAKDEVPFAIVYRSDAVSEPKVREVDMFPAASHAPILYPIAAVKGRDVAGAKRLIALLRGEAARKIFVKYGFTLPSP